MVRPNNQAKDRLLLVRPSRPSCSPWPRTSHAPCSRPKGWTSYKHIVGDDGKLPSFWIAVADLVDRDGKRVPRRLSFET